MSWKSKVVGCFGNTDFSSRTLDEGNTRDLILEAKIAGASFEELEREMIWNLYRRGATREQMDKQIDHARRLWSPS
ncbi:hypothetical protein LCM4573_25285 [Rhizobium sp. LCM 4573]|nr:hypothetical protein LCM4573_25285 [Rhizobium sp. LCM 4573]